jgi:hypothetical protein
MVVTGTSNLAPKYIGAFFLLWIKIHGILKSVQQAKHGSLELGISLHWQNPNCTREERSMQICLAIPHMILKKHYC